AGGPPVDLTHHSASVEGATTHADHSLVDQFLQHALAQTGDAYNHHETDLHDPDPHSFDCSELVQWAAAQVGINLPDGSWNQAQFMKDHGALISVDQALHTPGALLLRSPMDSHGNFSGGPGHVAISLGNGMTIEARGTAYGVGSWSGVGRPW